LGRLPGGFSRHALLAGRQASLSHVSASSSSKVEPSNTRAFGLAVPNPRVHGHGLQAENVKVPSRKLAAFDFLQARHDDLMQRRLSVTQEEDFTV
jgi:hypothetical protein